MTETPAAPVICVLGMHRSGTSCLIGSLQAAGLNLGKYHSWNRFNQKGNRENQDIVDFHDRLLADNAASWDKPPRRIKPGPAHIKQARAIAASFPPKVRWGFKDPRALLALDVWKRAIPRLQFIGIFRHPLAVAASLNRRSAGGMPDQLAFNLWYHYNKRLHDEFQRQAFPLLCFDWEEELFHERLNQMLVGLGFETLDADQRFYSSDLRNFDSRETDTLPWKIKRLYRTSNLLPPERGQLSADGQWALIALALFAFLTNWMNSVR